MKRPKLLYASPFPPMQSGISDYSVVLVQALADCFDITLYIDNYEISNQAMKEFSVLRYGRDTVDFSAFDYCLYNMGNSMFHRYIYETAMQHPDVVLLHDLALGHFMMEYLKMCNCGFYTSAYQRFKIEEFHALVQAIREQKLGTEFFVEHPLNDELLLSGNRFLVHSDYAMGKILNTTYIKNNQVKKIGFIQQVQERNREVKRNDLLQKFGIPLQSVLICAFGHIQETKLNLETIQVINELIKNDTKNIYYIMVGNGHYIDQELSDHIIKTGYTTLDEFNAFIHYADIVINLRYPTLGETSASLMRAMQLGKPCIINSGGWFSEIPEDAVLRIELNDTLAEIKGAILALLENEELRIRIGKNAKNYVETTHDTKTIIHEIYDFLVSYHKTQEA